eukprot:g6964.t1
MKFTIFIISILLLLAVSTQGGTLRKKSLEQRAHALKALVATSTPEDIKLSTIRSELRELVAAFSHEKTLLRGLAALKCHANVTEKISISDVMQGGYNTTDVNVACGKNTLFGKDIRRLHEIMIQCPLVIADYNMLHAKISKNIDIAKELKRNYTKAKENFEVKHGFIFDRETYHGSVVMKVLDGLIKRVDIFVKNNSTLGVDATPETGTNTISAQPATKTEAQKAESLGLLEVNPESNGKGGIKQLQWLLQRLHERVTVKWEGERNETAPLKAVWAEKEAKFMTAVNKIKNKVNRLRDLEKERKKRMDICTCKTRTGMGNFDSIDPANDTVVDPQDPSENIDKDDETGPSSSTGPHGHAKVCPPPSPADFQKAKSHEDKYMIMFEYFLCKADKTIEQLKKHAGADGKMDKAEFFKYMKELLAANAGTSNSVCPACDTKNQYCNTETKKCQDKHNDNDVCTKDENCYHICMHGKCQAEKIVGESCTEERECTTHNAYCDTTAKACKYRHVKHMECTNNKQVYQGHYCQGGYVHEYKVEGEQCDSTENRCDPDRILTCTNGVCKAYASFLEVLAAPPFLDEAFRPEIYIAGNLSLTVLPKMLLPTLKAVDEVFDDTLMHKTMLAESDTQSWMVTQKDYFHDFKRYYKFKPVGKTQQVELTFETIDLECKYSQVLYYESNDCDDNAAKQAMFKKDAPRVCNTVNANGGKRFPFTQGPVQLQGKKLQRGYSKLSNGELKYEL